MAQMQTCDYMNAKDKVIFEKVALLHVCTEPPSIFSSI